MRSAKPHAVSLHVSSRREMFFRQVLHEDLGCASYVVADGGEAADHRPEMGRRGLPRARRGARLHHHARPRDAQPRRPRLGQGTAGEGDRGVDPRAGDGRGRVRARADRRRRHGHGRRGHDHGARDARAPARAHGVSRRRREPGRGAVARRHRRLALRRRRRSPDLAVDPEEGARGLFASLKRLLALGDFAEVWPGHIGGSLCGGAGMSEKPVTTIGFERRFNRLLARDDEDGFVRALTGNLAPPAAELQAHRRAEQRPAPDGAAAARRCSCPPRCRRVSTPARPSSTAGTRASSTACTSRAPSTSRWCGRPSGRGPPGSSTPRARSSSPPRRDDEARRIGLPARGGRLPADRRGAGRRDRGLAGGRPPGRDDGRDRHPRAAPNGSSRGDVRLLDVRDDGRMGRGPRRRVACTFPTTTCANGLPDDLRNGGKPLAVACSAGNRSSIAVSLLRRAGFDDVIHVAEGGVAELAEEGIELVREKP